MNESLCNTHEKDFLMFGPPVVTVTGDERVVDAGWMAGERKEIVNVAIVTQTRVVMTPGNGGRIMIQRV